MGNGWLKIPLQLVAVMGEGTTFPHPDDLLLEDGTIIPASERTKREVYSRVVGYLRPVEAWNIGKQEEWKDRITYKTGGLDVYNYI